MAIYSGFSHEKLWFSIVYVKLPEGIPIILPLYAHNIPITS